MGKKKIISDTTLLVLLNFPFSNEAYQSQMAKVIDCTNTAVIKSFKFLMTKGLLKQVNSKSKRTKMYCLTDKGLQAKNAYTLFKRLCS